MFNIHSLFDMFDIVIKIFEMILWRLHHLRSLRTNLANKALSFFDESCSIKLMNKTWKSFADVWPSWNLSSHFWVQNFLRNSSNFSVWMALFKQSDTSVQKLLILIFSDWFPCFINQLINLKFQHLKNDKEVRVIKYLTPSAAVATFLLQNSENSIFH